MKTQAAVFGNTARLREKLVLGKNAEEVVALDDHLTLQRAEPEQHLMVCDLIKKLRTSPTQKKVDAANTHLKPCMRMNICIILLSIRIHLLSLADRCVSSCFNQTKIFFMLYYSNTLNSICAYVHKTRVDCKFSIDN